MKRFSLRIDENLLARLTELAERERRSINEQILRLIEQATSSTDDRASVEQYRNREEKPE